MNPAIYTALGVVLAAGVTAYVTWLVATRTKSGRVDTTEAAKLWDEGTEMRQELRSEVVRLRGQLAENIAAMTDLNREIRQSRAETESAREETRLSRAETRELRAEIKELHGDVKTYNALSIGALADNTETRRILDVPKSERTDVEFDHLASVGERQPEGEHPPVADDELRAEDVKIEKEPSDG